MKKTNLEGKGEGHDDVCHHDVLQVNDEVRFGGYAQKHPGGHAVEDQSQQEEHGVEDGKDHGLHHVVTGAGAVRVAVVGGGKRERRISVHGGRLKGTTAWSCQVD